MLVSRLASLGRAIRAHLWWWRPARIWLPVFVLILTVARLVLVAAPVDLTP